MSIVGPQTGWQIKSGVLGFLEADGEFHVPSAEDLFDAEVDGQDTVLSHKYGRISSNLGLRFSPHPIRVELRVEPATSPDLTGLRALPVVVGPHGPVPLTGLASREADHIVLDSDWYPFPRGALADLKQIVRELGIQEDQNLTLPQYFALLKLKGGRGDNSGQFRGPRIC